MKSFNYVITDEVGIHARPAGLLVKEAKKYESTVTIVKGDRKADARKLMMLMSLGVKCGEEITVEAEGPDEDAAAAGLEKFFRRHCNSIAYPVTGQNDRKHDDLMRKWRLWWKYTRESRSLKGSQ